jgi:hypothetical protein
VPWSHEVRKTGPRVGSSRSGLVVPGLYGSGGEGVRYHHRLRSGRHRHLPRLRGSAQPVFPEQTHGHGAFSFSAAFPIAFTGTPKVETLAPTVAGLGPTSVFYVAGWNDTDGYSAAVAGIPETSGGVGTGPVTGVALSFAAMVSGVGSRSRSPQELLEGSLYAQGLS